MSPGILLLVSLYVKNPGWFKIESGAVVKHLPLTAVIFVISCQVVMWSCGH